MCDCARESIRLYLYPVACNVCTYVRAEILEEHFTRHAKGGKSTKVIVFTQLRSTVRAIVADLADTKGDWVATGSYLSCDWFFPRDVLSKLFFSFLSLLFSSVTITLLAFTFYPSLFPLFIDSSAGVCAQGFIGQASKAATEGQEALKGLNQKEQAAILQVST